MHATWLSVQERKKKCTLNFPAAQAARLVSKPGHAVRRRSSACAAPRPSQGTHRSRRPAFPSTPQQFTRLIFIAFVILQYGCLTYFQISTFMKEVIKRVKKKNVIKVLTTLIVCFIARIKPRLPRGRDCLSFIICHSRNFWQSLNFLL